MADEFVEKVSATIAEQIRAGEAPWLQPREAGEPFLPYNPATGNEYRSGNAMWLMAQAHEQGFSDRRWMTAGQAEQQGAEVRAGEQGTPVQFWKRDADQPRVMRAMVFNAEQMENVPPDRPPPALAEAERASLHLASFTGAAHVLGDEPRGSEGAAKEEMRAEIGALMLGHHLQTGHEPGQRAYTETWAKVIERDPTELFRAAADAQRVVNTVRGLEIEAPVVSRPAVVVSPVEQFAEALRERGLRLEGLPEMDGALHRVPVEGDKTRERSGTYVGHLDGRPAGFIENFKTGERTTWKAEGVAVPLTAAERAQQMANAQERQVERTAEREAGYEQGAAKAAALWANALEVTSHPYLDTKQVASHGLRQAEDGRLMVPVMNAEGQMQSLQFIGEDGSKQFMQGGKVSGGHFVLGDLTEPGPVVIAEGYATAATVHELTEKPVIVAFNAGNLQPVAEVYRELHPDRAIYIAGDNDVGAEERGMPNVGRDKAERTAAAVNGIAVYPDRGDWNDLAIDRGRDEARINLTSAFAVAGRELLVQEKITAREQEADRVQTITPVVTRTPVKEPETEEIER